VTVVGIGADGWAGLPPRLRDVVAGAAVLLGGRRHLDLVPEGPGQRRETWPSPLREGLPALIASLTDGPVVALASGDPLLSGIGTTLVELLGSDAVTVEPAVSSVALARAAMGWAAESHAVVSVVGRDVDLLRRELSPGRRILVLSSDERSPRDVARVLIDAGYAESAVTVLADLGGPSASVTRFARSDDLCAETTFGRLSIVAVECAGHGVGGWAAGLPDPAYEHDGQLTKRDLRASALARLLPRPGQHLWDVGAGAGSVAIEWMRAHPTCTATAVEADPERAARIARNASALGVPGLTVVNGRAPDVLPGLRSPDAIFVGGGATRPGVLDACVERLDHGGRLVVHGVTIETERVLADRYSRHGGELVRISVETASPIGSFTGWTPARAVTQWSWER
jgi:precorrin-6Y C5,15-methyltransferase (decarboxylating)